jgi:hypothetical protein
MKFVDRVGHVIEYRLNIIGIRVTETACQLIARNAAGWTAVPRPARADGDVLYNTAYLALQYCDGTKWQQMPNPLTFR